MSTATRQRARPGSSSAISPRRSPASRVLLALAATAVIAGAASLTGRPALVMPLVIGGVTAALVSALIAVRGNLRDSLIEHLRAALTPVIGEGARVRVVASRWTGMTRVGHPRRLSIYYLPGVKDDSPEWRSMLLATVERRLLVHAQVRKLDQLRCRAVLALEPLTDPSKTPAAVERARLIVAELFGARAQFSYQLDGAGLKSVTVQHELRTRAAMPMFRLKLERVYSANLPDRWRAKWDLTTDTVTFERRPTLPKLIPHRAAAITDQNRYLIPICVNEDGHLLVWDLRGSGPHLMVVGRTGKGKTVAIMGAVTEFCRRGWPVWILDPKRIEFMAMRSWHNVQIVATTVLDMIATIKSAHDLMEQRYAAIEAGADESEFEPLLLVLDEFRNFHRLVASWYASVKVRGMPSQCPVFEWIAAIAEKGRSAKVHLIIGTQRPDADFMTGSMRDNFDTRLALGPLSPQGAKMMWDSPHLGVSIPRKLRGRGTAIDSDDSVVEVQVPWTPDPRRADGAEDLQILAELRPLELVHPPLRVQLPEPGTEDPAADWDAVAAAKLLPADTEDSTDNNDEAQPTGQRPVLSLVAAAEDNQQQDLVDAEDDNEPEDEDQFRDYQDAEDQPASHVEPGDLLLVDERLDVWAVVEAAEPDFGDSEQLLVSWRGDDDDYGVLSVDAGEMLHTRRPINDED